MKSSLIFLVLGCITLLGFTTNMHAESGNTQNPISTAPVVAAPESPLLVDAIKAIDTKHVDIIFNQPIIRESVRVRITEQSNDSNIRIESLSGVMDDNTVRVILTDSIEADAAYKMTIVSAISEEGIIIKDGADGLKEFTTPLDLREYTEEVPIVLELNAPTNPNAIVVGSTGTDTTSANNSIMVATGTEKMETVSPSETTEELPPAGSNPLIYLGIAGSIAFILLIRRRRA